MKLRIGSGLPNIQKKDLAKFKITIPNISEQKVISAFLSSFERKAEIVIPSIEKQKQVDLHLSKLAQKIDLEMKILQFVQQQKNFWIQRKVQDILAVSSPLYENKCTLD